MSTILRLTGTVALGAALALPLLSGCAGTTMRESTGEYVDDTVITAKVKTALVRDSTVSALDVNVETFKGTVQLSGFVDTEEQKVQAERLAQGVAGVSSVTNSIVVKAGAAGAPQP